MQSIVDCQQTTVLYMPNFKARKTLFAKCIFCEKIKNQMFMNDLKYCISSTYEVEQSEFISNKACVSCP